MDVVAIATITPLRLRAGIEGRGRNMEISFKRRCVPVVFSLDFTISKLKVILHISILV